MPSDFDVTQDQDLIDLVGNKDNQRQACLVVVAGNQLGQMFVLEPGTTSIGRSDECDLIVDEGGVSRKHAEIIMLSTEQVVFRDLGSTNGSLINSTTVKNEARELRDGDRIQIGGTLLLKFSYQDKLDESFQRHLYDSAVRDGLTGVYNKRYLAERLEQEWAAKVRHNTTLSLIILDIDHFKRINDSLGHNAGDRVLKEVATAIDTALRREEVFARYGGEEFVILLRETSLESAEQCAERMRKVVEELQIPWQGEAVKVTVSLGVASTAADPEAPSAALMERADRWLYAAKGGGRNCWRSDDKQ